MIDIALLTDARWVAPDPACRHGETILSEDRALVRALADNGMYAQRIAWDDPDVDWGSVGKAVFRTTWDYLDHLDRFRSWLRRAASRTALVNDFSLVDWNLNKRYLLDLAQTGLPVVETVCVATGSDQSLSDMLSEHGWRQAVIKPAISASGRDTHRVTDGGDSENLWRSLVGRQEMVVQPFEEAILDQGEISIAVINGNPCHAVRKRARSGEFRVQNDHGGTVEPYRATDAELSLAVDCVSACTPEPVYARVDMVRARGGRPRLMELELIEPELFFRFFPASAEVFAEALAAG